MELREHKPVTIRSTKSGGIATTGRGTHSKQLLAQFHRAEALIELLLKLKLPNQSEISQTVSVLKRQIRLARQLSVDSVDHPCPNPTSKNGAQSAALLKTLQNQGHAARAEEFARGNLLPASEFQSALNISRQAISKAIKENRLFCLDGPCGENWYPAFFADASQNRRSLERVCKQLGELPGPSKWQFFTTGKHTLDGRTPLQALAAGELERVLIAAAGFAER